MEKRMGHIGIEHIFTCIDIDKHTYIYLYIESFTYTNYTDMFIYRKFLKLLFNAQGKLFVYFTDGLKQYRKIQFSSVTQSCPTLCNPMNCSTPGLAVHHQLPEFNQTHVHRVGDAIRPSHPLLSPSPPAPYPSQHQSLFQ